MHTVPISDAERDERDRLIGIIREKIEQMDSERLRLVMIFCL